MKFIINNSYTQVVDCLAQALEQIADWCKVNYSYWGQDWTFKPPRKIIRNKSIYYLNQDGFFPTGWAGKFIKELNEQGHSIKIQDERRKPNYTICFLGDEDIKLRDYQQEALDVMLKTGRGIIHHATGAGKCKIKSGFIMTEFGFEKLEELGSPGSSKFIQLKNKTCSSFTKNNLISHVYSDGIKPTKTITTRFGFEDEAGLPHRYRIWEPNKGIAWKKAQDLKKDDFLILARPQKILGHPQKITFNQKLKKDGYRGKELILPEKIDNQLALFMGYYIAEGNMIYSKTSGRMSLSSMDESIIKDLTAFGEKIGILAKIKKDTRGGKHKHIHFYSHNLASFLLWAGCGGNAHTKEIPWIIRKSGKDIICSFLRGYYSGDGSVMKEKSQVAVSTVSPHLAKQLQVVLFSLGMLPIRDIKKTSWQNGKSFAFRVKLNAESLPMFYSLIGFTVKHKKQRLQGHINNPKNPNPNYGFPFPLDLYKKIKNKTACDRLALQGLRLPSKARILNHIIPQLTQEDDFRLKQIISILERGLVLPIKTIKDSYGSLMDIFVPNGNEYWTDGFITHNTILTAATIKAIPVQTLVIVPDVNLLDQTAHESERFLGEDSVGKIGNSLWEPNHVTVSTIQTLGSRLKTNPTKVKSFLKNIDSLILDEGHHVNITGVKKPGKKKAGTPKPNTQYYEISMLTNAYYRFGLTATPGSLNKIERRLLEGVTGKVLHHVSSSYLIERGYLTQPIIQMYKSEVPPYKEWKDAQKHNIIENIHRNLFISKLAQGYAKQGKSVLITVDRIRHGNDLCEMLDEEAIFLSGKDDAEYRKTIFEDFKNKDLYILVSTIVREGVDIPSMDVIIRAEGGKSDRVTIQKMGRVLRKAEGKDKARIIDFYDDDGTKVSGTDNILRKHSKARLREYKREAAFDVQPLIDIPEIK